MAVEVIARSSAVSLQGRRLRRRRFAAERGAVLVEAAFVISFILTPLVFGAIEISFLVSHANALSDASRAATRVGVASLSTPTDDFYILQALATDPDLSERGDIKRVIVFRAAGTDGKPAAGCESGPVAGECNVYDGSDLQATKETIDSKQTAWAPSTRIGASTDEMPYLGVWVTADHNAVTGSFAVTDSLTGVQVMRIEPVSVRSTTEVTPNPAYTPYVYPG